MHPINWLLSKSGIRIQRIRAAPDNFIRRYEEDLRTLMEAKSPYSVIREFACDIGSHPASYREYECGFAASCLSQLKPSRILDVGSYRDFVLGLAASYQVTTLDVRPSPKMTANETVIVGDGKKLAFPNDHFDAIVSLSSIEHFGLGRYGDDFDLDADQKSLAEMIRTLKPGGFLIFSTTLTGGRPCLVFNLHRIYTLELLHRMCSGLRPQQEMFFSHRLGRFAPLSEVVTSLGAWDVYCGSWLKPPSSGLELIS